MLMPALDIRDVKRCGGPREDILHGNGLMQAASVARSLAVTGYYKNHIILSLSMSYVNLRVENPGSFRLSGGQEWVAEVGPVH